DDRGDLIAWAQGARLTRNGQAIVAPSKNARPIAALNADSADYARHNHCSLGGLRLRAIPSPAYRLALAAVGEVDAAISLVGGLGPFDLAGGHPVMRRARRE